MPPARAAFLRLAQKVLATVSMIKRNAFVALLATLLFATACATTNTAGMNMPGRLSDADVAGIVVAANEGEIQQGNAAASRATNADVRNFAQMMVSDHTNALNAARDLAGRNNMTPAENDTTAALRSGTQQTIQSLGTYSGTAFDRTYMQTQVDLHQWLLSVMDSHLIPSARNADLRAQLTTQRASVAAHLERARAILGGVR
jgi:putative membrane protein